MPKPSFAKEGAWIQTNSGRQVFFDAENTAPENIWLPDIAHALYNCNRFAGQLQTNWSVGQHSMAMGLYFALTKSSALAILDAFLHDAHEAYMGDMPAPFKWVVPEVLFVQSKLQKDIMVAAGIKESRYAGEPWDKEDDQANVDLMMCRAEAEMFFLDIKNHWTQELPKPNANIYKAINAARGTDSLDFHAACRLHAKEAGINPELIRNFG